MALLILASTCSSPGVTTLGVGLALAWPRSVLLADCDQGAHQSVLAGYLAGRSANGKGLLRVAEAHRDGRPLREVVVDQTIPLSTDPSARRLFLPGFTKPGSASLFGGVWAELAETFDRLAEAEMDVIVDAGRIGVQGLPVPLLDHAAAVCLVLRTNLRSVMSARVHSPHLKEQAQLSAAERSLGLILVGDGDPYHAPEIAKALGLPVMATVAYGPEPAQHLSDGKPRSRKFDTTPLAKSLHTTAGTLHSQLQRTVERIGS
jgi:hypothetical protein